MTLFSAAGLLAAVTSSTLATEVTFYLGTYTHDGMSKGIYVGTLDADTGRLGQLQLAAEAVNPSFLALSPNGKNLYAVAESDGGVVTAYVVVADGTLSPLNQLPSGAGACHVWVDAGGRNVLSANYSGASFAVFQTLPDGSLRERTALVPLTGSGPDPKRQRQSYGHAIYTDPAARFVYGCDLGSDNVWVYRFDAAQGSLSPAEPPSGKVPPGGGPRHLAFHPGGGFVYVANEMGMSVTAFARDPEKGVLTPLETVSTLPPETPVHGSSTAEILCHPGGKWLYVSNRGHDSIAVYSIRPDGRLDLLEVAPAQVRVPRGVGMDPGGKWLVVAGQDDHRITVLGIDQTTGKLSPTDQSAQVGSPVCVIFKQ